LGAAGNDIVIRIGMLTPSSNTVLEPVTARLLARRGGATAHFARFRVTEIGLGDKALGQFEDAPILAAAALLADAKVDIIAWNGTSASWLGLQRDRDLVSRIESATGVRATTCMLGFFEDFARLGIRTLGLVTPYTADVQRRIMDTYRTEGIEVIAEEHSGISDNFSFGLIAEQDIAAAVERTLAAKPDAVAIVCTNMNGAAAAERLQAMRGVPVLDSVAVTLEACLRRMDAAPP
jgi:maleate isomerase